MRHELKILPAFFEPVCLGYKTFEIRKNDRNFHVGDELILREWDGEKYTGNQVHRYVSYILYEWQDSLKDGYCVMSLKSMPSVQPDTSRIENALHGKSAEEQYEFIRWLMQDYGMLSTDTRTAVIEWLRGERNG